MKFLRNDPKVDNHNEKKKNITYSKQNILVIFIHDYYILIQPKQRKTKLCYCDTNTCKFI